MTQMSLFDTIPQAAPIQGRLNLNSRHVIGAAPLKSCRADALAMVKRWGMAAHDGARVTLHTGHRSTESNGSVYYSGGWHRSFGDWRQALQAVMRWHSAEARGIRRPWLTEGDTEIWESGQ